MVDQNLKQMVAKGIGAMKAGSDVAAKATSEIQKDASSPDLKAALDEGNKTSQKWAERIDRAVSQAGDGQTGDNPVMEAQYEVSRRIREAAPGDNARDLGIIANGQLALHYWIAAFGTMANYLKALGMNDVAGDMKTSADEAKRADEQHTQLAEKLLQA